MREKFEYKEIEITLGSIANNPNFSDMERNWADELWTSLKNSEEPKQPTHEEIMTLWWKDSENDTTNHLGYIWVKIDKYIPEAVCCYGINGDFNETHKGQILRQRDKKWFTGRESAIIPPESV